MSEELALVLDIEIGNRDLDNPGIWFTVASLSGNALIVIPFKDCLDFIRKSQCYKLSDLKRKCCVINVEDGLVKFDRWFP
jgi:hypothetical protein